MPKLSGIDQYSGSWRPVTVEAKGAHVLITVDGSDGNGESLLTPAQACQVARWLQNEAKNAESDVQVVT